LTVSNARYTEAYGKHTPQMIAYARDAAVDEAEDVVHDTFMEVMALPSVPDGDIGGLLMQRLKWRIVDLIRKRKELMMEDQPLMQETNGHDEGEYVGGALERIELMQMDRTTPAWPSVIDWNTPEDIVSAEQLREHIREIATEACGAEAYAMFCAVTIDGVHQERVAKEFRVSQATVSRNVTRVRDEVQQVLLAEGYDV
jgi:RNA polymerase sigma factor (sigma-70 family)